MTLAREIAERDIKFARDVRKDPYSYAGRGSKLEATLADRLEKSARALIVTEEELERLERRIGEQAREIEWLPKEAVVYAGSPAKRPSWWIPTIRERFRNAWLNRCLLCLVMPLHGARKTQRLPDRLGSGEGGGA